MLRYGPASVLYGDTSTAGLLNLVSKRPQAEACNEIGVQYGSFNRKQVRASKSHRQARPSGSASGCIASSAFRDSGTQTDWPRSRTTGIKKCWRRR